MWNPKPMKQIRPWESTLQCSREPSKSWMMSPAECNWSGQVRNAAKLHLVRQQGEESKIVCCVCFLKSQTVHNFERLRADHMLSTDGKEHPLRENCLPHQLWLQGHLQTQRQARTLWHLLRPRSNLPSSSSSSDDEVVGFPGQRKTGQPPQPLMPPPARRAGGAGELNVVIATWAHRGPPCRQMPCLTIDAEEFHHGTRSHGDYHTGMHKDVLEFVIRSPLFSATLLSAKDKLVTLLKEQPQCLYIDIRCRWGKQASVAWAIIMRHIFHEELQFNDINLCHNAMDMWTCGRATGKAACCQCLSFEAQSSIQCLLIEAQHLWSMLPTKS